MYTCVCMYPIYVFIGTHRCCIYIHKKKREGEVDFPMYKKLKFQTLYF